jgi:acyl carrier protein
MRIDEFLKQEIKNLVFKNVDTTESLIKSGLLSSITVVDLAVLIEENYKIKIPFTDISKDNFDTIELMIQFLKSKGLKEE